MGRTVPLMAERRDPGSHRAFAQTTAVHLLLEFEMRRAVALRARSRGHPQVGPGGIGEADRDLIVGSTPGAKQSPGALTIARRLGER